MTKQHVYSEIACRFGVNPFNPFAVKAFFKNLNKLTLTQRTAIIAELNARSNEPENEVDEIVFETGKIIAARAAVVPATLPITCANPNLTSHQLASNPPNRNCG